jgi:hypothetical protein
MKIQRLLGGLNSGDVLAIDSKITGGPELWRRTRYRCSELAANAAETSLNISLFEWLILEEPQLQHSGETNVAQVNTVISKIQRLLGGLNSGDVLTTDARNWLQTPPKPR